MGVNSKSCKEDSGCSVRTGLSIFNTRSPSYQPSFSIAMAKDKSEKKEKKSKEVKETVTESIVAGADVDMEDVAVAKVSLHTNSGGVVSNEIWVI